MLRIIVEIVPGGIGTPKMLAEARIGNISDLADVSDYAVYAKEGDNHLANAGMWDARGVVENHDRRQTVWRLVEKVAAWAADAGDRRRGK